MNWSYQQQEEYSPQLAFLRATRELCGCELADCLFEDLSLFQDRGLDGIAPELKDELMRKYERFETPYSREIVAWLNGEYPYSPECLTE